jgi:hypothetical protein
MFRAVGRSNSQAGGCDALSELGRGNFFEIQYQGSTGLSRELLLPLLRCDLNCRPWDRPHSGDWPRKRIYRTRPERPRYNRGAASSPAPTCCPQGQLPAADTHEVRRSQPKFAVAPVQPACGARIGQQKDPHKFAPFRVATNMIPPFESDTSPDQSVSNNKGVPRIAAALPGLIS